MLGRHSANVKESPSRIMCPFYQNFKVVLEKFVKVHYVCMSFMCHLFLESMWQQGKEQVYNFTLFSCILSCQTLSFKLMECNMYDVNMLKNSITHNKHNKKPYSSPRLGLKYLQVILNEIKELFNQTKM